MDYTGYVWIYKWILGRSHQILYLVDMVRNKIVKMTNLDYLLTSLPEYIHSVLPT